MLNPLIQLINNQITEDPPIKIEQGNVIKEGVNKELDDLRKIAKGGQDWIINYQNILVESTGISTLKIKFNKVFGYFIEVSAGQKNNVPDYFIRKQTLTNTERFTTEKLTEYQEKVLNAEEQIIKLENELFQNICQEVLNYTQEIQEVAETIAKIDVNSSLAELAVENNYCKPEVIEKNCLEIIEGRHPVVEILNDNFIPNDTIFNSENRFVLLSGPNMAGKSTYLRQTALIIYLSHLGSFVPATSAKIGVTDKIFTRVGAGDNLSSGESTFMMEMLEASTILHNATEQSFIILDELGRGTSTFDGLSIAWAITEHLHDKIKARTIFATHYHELIEAVKSLEKAKNYSVAVIENESQGVVFLYKITEGGTDKSYGIEVAKLSGMPDSVLKRAQEILHNLEEKKEKTENQLQMDLFTISSPSSKVEKQESNLEKNLKNLNINTLSPLEALNLLQKWQKEL